MIDVFEVVQDSLKLIQATYLFGGVDLWPVFEEDQDGLVCECLVFLDEFADCFDEHQSEATHERGAVEREQALLIYLDVLRL